MAVIVAINHRTEYKYDRNVLLSPHQIRLWPTPHCRTPILSKSLKITPRQNFLNWQQDPYSNYIARVVFPEPTKELIIEVDLTAEMTVINPFDFFVEPTAADFPFEYEPKLLHELSPFLEKLPVGPKLKAWMDGVPRKKIPTNDFMVSLNQRLQRDIKYIIRMEPGIQTCEESLTKLSGSCRDSAWLLVQIFRNLGLAARFVSGYLVQLKPDEKSLDGPSGTEVDFTDLHAWTEVFLPGAGWIGLDPTSGLLAGEGHIPLACTADPATAGPVQGGIISAEECKTEFNVSMSVTRIHEDPRVTKPYGEREWLEIQALGHTIDAKLKKNDVRLTMGGEPTFVAIDGRDDPEWNTTAVGPRKRAIADTLLKRLRDKFSNGAMLHHGQGKWYPGEPLPRWAFGCYWRKDGEPIWRNQALCADESVNRGYNDADARRFVEQLAGRLKVDSKYAMPGYEDAFHYMLEEQKLPVNIDPLECNLKDAEVRKRISRILDQGLNKVVGYALPVQRVATGGDIEWRSGAWSMRREHLFLVPGDSPMGFRLPLGSLPWMADEKQEYPHELDPLMKRGPLPPHEHIQQHVMGGPSEHERLLREFRPQELSGLVSHDGSLGSEPDRKAGKEGSRSAIRHSASQTIRTCLCVEPRNGQLYIFMPPQRYLEDYLALVAAVEETAAALRSPVLIEGYTPPHDDRLNVLKVTPDPGVLEVNIHPSASWDELQERTKIIYEEARLSRLTTEKFMLDGRHTGTGGGNHVLLGGATPADSPMLRRPDVLRSLINYWHNHPALSFMFSGIFVGPTSQAPRIDEARNDSVYEMELAFKQIPDRIGTPPWLVDRVLRNLLIDSSGNTHRSEFSIDKLYSPDSSTGRLGLVELRAFEMPPHYQMSLVQQLLLRTLVAKFWENPYQCKMVRWGTELHDRFMLPHFVKQDFGDVITDLRDHGYKLNPEWFTPHLDFRFPKMGEFDQRGVHVELRQAIEPWHVLGEESGGGGTVRFVDSSVERLQLKVKGMTDTRHSMACNGQTIPLHPTGINGEFVAGVRYRAWQPPSCLHPTIGVDSPLSFDLVDTWNSRSLGGCTYHVAHPGGRSHETFPVNAFEAEGRRISRFFKCGHTPGFVHLPPAKRSGEFPFTLDLRH